MPALNPAEISAIDTAHIWHPYSTIGAEALPAVVATEAHGIMLTLIHEGGPVQVIDAMSSWWTAVHGHGHPVLADFPGIANGKRLAQMQRQLMAEKVDIYPALRAAALSTAQHVAIKASRRDQVVNVIGEMKK